MTSKVRKLEADVLSAGFVFVDDTRNRREVVEIVNLPAGQRVRWRVPGKEQVREVRIDAWLHWVKKFNARRVT